MKSLSLILGAISLTDAKLSAGTCPEVEIMDNFQPEKYAGKWFEVARDVHNTYSYTAECVTKEFGINKEGDVDLYFRGKYMLMPEGN